MLTQLFDNRLNPFLKICVYKKIIAIIGMKS